MQHSSAVPRRTRLAFSIGVTALLVAGAISAILASQTASSAASSPATTAPTPAALSPAAPSFDEIPRTRPDDVGGALTQDDGILPGGVTVFDDEYPAITRLDAALLGAMRAAADAAPEGIEFDVSSGWRSRAYQDQLLRDAVVQYGSEAEAARWVATADTSLHVSGNAIDIGSPDAAAWLADHGGGYGLCRVYDNEPWHFELRPDAIGHGCPPTYADPTQDPRMQR